MTVVPPIKSQGIKTKLACWIRNCAEQQIYDRWVEPFMGTGAVAFNVRPRTALLCDANPHVIRFYQAIKDGRVTASIVQRSLHDEAHRLSDTGGEYYYEVRDRFNTSGDPLDFLFLSRSCFNGMMRFNGKGYYNVPFCRKPDRFSKSLVTKITNQVAAVEQIVCCSNFTFKCQDFRATLEEVNPRDLVYCDPPYARRHADYFNRWSEKEERSMQRSLFDAGVRFIISSWLQNQHRRNSEMLADYSDLFIDTFEHFYHVGAREQNRGSMFEALITSFPTRTSVRIRQFNDVCLLERKREPASEQNQPLLFR